MAAKPLVLGAAPISNASKQIRAEQLSVIERQVLIRLRARASVSELKHLLLSKAKVVDSETNLVIVQFPKKVTPGDLSFIKSIPTVDWAVIDRAETEQLETGTCVQESVSIPASIASVAEVVAPPACSISEKCESTGRTKLWAQEEVDADLMMAELNKLGLLKEMARVAVVEEGFDQKHRASMMAKPPVLRKGSFWWSDVEPGVDKTGHGTPVSSMIGGAEGLGVAPNVEIGIFASPASFAGSSIAARRACNKGYEIINYSHSSRESQQRIYSEAEIKFAQDLKESGCILVSSAGNWAWQQKFSDDLEDSRLLVSASSPFTGALARFSTTGEVTAPGDQVFALIDSANKFEIPSGRFSGCGKDSTALFVEGTSFSTPIVSGIAANVMIVLKKSKRFRKLAPGQRVGLVNRILKASELGGTVNGLRAVQIADRWEKQRLPAAVPITGLKSALNSTRDPVCDQANLHKRTELQN